MRLVKARVVLLNREHIDPRLPAAAGRLCYSPDDVDEIVESQGGKKGAFLNRMFARGPHTSPMGHVYFTFGIQGVSRACSHQLVRHAVGWNWNQQSQRYVDAREVGVVMPPEIERRPEARDAFLHSAEDALAAYASMREVLIAGGADKERAQEDARFLLPNCVETKLITTVNARALIQSSHVRLCLRAQWEIREVFSQMRELVRDAFPVVAEYMVAKCEALGYCDEGKMSCGRYPTREEVLGEEGGGGKKGGKKEVSR